MLNQRQAGIIAAVLEELRPGNWKQQQVLNVLAENRNTPHGFPVLLQVAINAALTPSVKSPTGIFLPGKHWDHAYETGSNLTLPPAPDCAEHTGQNAHNCSCCWADIKIGQRPQRLLGKLMPPAPPNTQHPAAATETALESIQAE